MSLNSRFVVDVLLTLVAVITIAYLLLAIFLFYTGSLSITYLPEHLLFLGSSVVFLYISRYHPMEHPIGRVLATIGTGIPFFGIATYLGWSIRGEIVLHDIQPVFQDRVTDPTFKTFLPEWWLVPILVFGGSLVLVGALTRWGDGTYPTPRQIIKLPLSPIFFGLFTTFLGLWAVLFVGIGLQRAIIIAPIFEEFLKFGIALIIGSAMFGRSLWARVGIALVVGMLFGLTEHAVSYASEPDTVYVFRTIFHSTSTMLSVGLYTRLEQSGSVSLLWYAPIVPIIFHFLYNLFVVASTMILLIIFDQELVVLPIAYGSIAIVIMLALLILSIFRLSWVIALHKPFKHTLSDLV